MKGFGLSSKYTRVREIYRKYLIKVGLSFFMINTYFFFTYKYFVIKWVQKCKRGRIFMTKKKNNWYSNHKKPVLICGIVDFGSSYCLFSRNAILQ